MAEINERLRAAAKAGSEVRLKALLRELGGDALAPGGKGMTALMWAACYGHAGCVGLLLLASEALVKNKDGWTALMWAAAHGHEECVGRLLPVSNALAHDGFGLTALMCAARYGHKGCVRILLPASDVLAQERAGRTASTWARNCEHESLAEFIDAYARVQSERADLGVATSPGAPRGRAALRV